AIAMQRTREWRERHAQLRALQTMSDPHQRALLQLASSLTAAQWNGLFDEEPLAYSSLGEPGTLLLPQAVEQVLRSQPPAWRLPGEPPLPPYRQLDGQRRYMEQLPREWSRAEGFRVTIEARASSYRSTR